VIPATARGGLMDYDRQIAELRSRREAYLAGMLAAMGIDERQVAEIDLATGTIRLHE
jgi:hypothetical protein